MIALIIKIWLIGFFITIFLNLKVYENVNTRALTYNKKNNINSPEWIINLACFSAFTIKVITTWPYLILLTIERYYIIYMIKKEVRNMAEQMDDDEISKIVEELKKEKENE